MCGPVLSSSNAAAVSLTSTKLSINLQHTHALLSLIWQSAHNAGAHCFVAGLFWFVFARVLMCCVCVCLLMEPFQHVTRGRFWQRATVKKSVVARSLISAGTNVTVWLTGSADGVAAVG